MTFAPTFIPGDEPRVKPASTLMSRKLAVSDLPQVHVPMHSLVFFFPEGMDTTGIGNLKWIKCFRPGGLYRNELYGLILLKVLCHLP